MTKKDIGKLCVFWDYTNDIPSKGVCVGILTYIDNTHSEPYDTNGITYKYCCRFENFDWSLIKKQRTIKKYWFIWYKWEDGCGKHHMNSAVATTEGVHINVWQIADDIETAQNITNVYITNFQQISKEMYNLNKL